MKEKEERNYTVYKHTSPSGKIYIGMTGQKRVEDRWNSGHGYKGQPFYHAIKKYGWDNIQHEIIAEGLTKEEAENMEIKLIAEYKSNQRDFGYNIDNGGSSVGKIGEEAKGKMSEAKKGEKHPYWGKPRPEEVRKKISESHKGITHTEETKRKLSELQKGKRTREKHHSAVKIYCGGLIFLCAKTCAEYYDKKYHTMMNWLIGHRKMPKEFIDLGLRYATEEDINTYPVYKRE